MGEMQLINAITPKWAVVWWGCVVAFSCPFFLLLLLNFSFPRSSLFDVPRIVAKPLVAEVVFVKTLISLHLYFLNLNLFWSWS